MDHSSFVTSVASQPRATPVASWWHTVILIVYIIAFSTVEGLPRNVARAATLQSRIPLYLITLAIELSLFAYVWLLGLRPRSVQIREIIGGRWDSFGDFLLDVVIAFLFWIVVVAILALVRFFLPYNGIQAAKTMLPRTMAEMIVFVVLAVTAGFCEEFVFRGYLQRQFLALAQSAWASIALQAILFGYAHLYQGWSAAAAIAIYGALFGILAWMRKSLRPGMMQHAAQDSLAGITASVLLRHKLI